MPNPFQDTNWAALLGLPAPAPVPFDSDLAGAPSVPTATAAPQSPPLSPLSATPEIQSTQVVDPNQASTSQVPVTTKEKNAAGGSVSQRTAFDQGQYGRVLSATAPSDSKADRAIKAEVAPYEQEMRQNVANTQAAEQQAIRSQYEYDQNMAQVKSNYWTRLAKDQQALYADEQRAAADSQHETNAAMANYKSQLAAVAAVKIDHNQLFRDKTAAGKFGMLASAFTGSYLDAKGVHNSILASLNKTIDDSVSDQMANLANMKDVAEGFKNLYTMASEDGANQAVVRARLRGLYLSQLETQMQAEASKYGSDLAKATAEKALAAVAKEKEAAIAEVDKTVYGWILQGKQLALTKRGQDLQASAQANALAWDKEKYKQQQATAKAGALDALRETVITDATEGNRGKPIRRAFSKEDAQKIRNAHSAAADLSDTASKLEAVFARAGSIGYEGKTGQILNSMDEKEGRALFRKLVADSLRAQSGAAVNEAEVERKAQEIGDLAWVSSLGSKEDALNLIRGYHDRALNAVQRMDESFSTALTPDQIEQYRALGITGENQAPQDAFGAETRNKLQDQRTPPPETPEARMAVAAATPSNKVIEATPPETWRKYGKELGWNTRMQELGPREYEQEKRDVAEAAADDPMAEKRARLLGVGDANAKDATSAEPVWAPHMDGLYMIVTDEKANPDTRKWAAGQLMGLAVDSKDSIKSGYASWLLDEAKVPYDRDLLETNRSLGAKRSDANASLLGSDWGGKYEPSYGGADSATRANDTAANSYLMYRGQLTPAHFGE